jgi:hypothetical protein
VKITRIAAAVAGMGLVAAGLVPAGAAEAASRCSGASGYWTCYSTTGTRTWHTKVMRSWILKNSTSRTKSNAKCNVTVSTSYSSSSSQSVTATAKVSLFKVAEASISGTQTFTNTLTTTEANSLEQSFTLRPGQSVTCQLFVGYYSVGTKYVHWNNYRIVESKSGRTTVPFNWGLNIVD